MAVVNIHDRADELRFEIIGTFEGACVQETQENWIKCLPQSLHRRVTVDISALTGYDGAGRDLLCEMHYHGMRFAAGTPQSLVFLSDISGPYIHPADEPLLTSKLEHHAAGQIQ